MNKVNERGAWYRQLWFARRLSLSPVLYPFLAKFSPQIIPALHSIGQRGLTPVRFHDLLCALWGFSEERASSTYTYITNPPSITTLQQLPTSPKSRRSKKTHPSSWSRTNRAYTHWVECDISVLFLHHSITPSLHFSSLPLPSSILHISAFYTLICPLRTAPCVYVIPSYWSNFLAC